MLTSISVYFIAVLFEDIQAGKPLRDDAGVSITAVNRSRWTPSYRIKPGWGSEYSSRIKIERKDFTKIRYCGLDFEN
jgi:hypothetical protein